MEKSRMLLFVVISLSLVFVSNSALIGTGIGPQIGRGSATVDVNADALIGNSKSLARIVACDRVNLLITTDGFLFMSGGIGGDIVKLTNFTPPELVGRLVVDGSCFNADVSGQTRFIVSTDDYKVFTFSSNGFNIVNSSFALWVGSLTELGIDAGVAGYPIKKVTSGGNAFAIVFENGRVVLFGNNAYGKLGTASSTVTVTALQSLVVPAASGGGNELFGDVALSNYHSLLCGFSGYVYASGRNDNGELLTSNTVPSEAFVPWSMTAHRCVSVFATNFNSFVLTTTGRVISVGTSAAGQLGRTAFATNTVPGFVNLPTTVRVSSLAVAAVDDDAYVLALAYNSSANRRTIYGWGANQASSMAGFSGVPTASPRELIYVVDDLRNRVPISISAARQHTNVQTDSGYLTWTATASVANGAGVFGIFVYDEPVDIRNRIFANDDFVQIQSAANDDPATYGVLRNNVLMRWGRGYSDPIQINYNSLAKITDISVGRAFVVILNDRAEAWTHGTNLFGELGNSSFARSTDLQLVRVSGLQQGVISVAATDISGFAVKSDGTLWFWGTVPQGGWLDLSPDFRVGSPVEVILRNTFAELPLPLFKAVFTGAVFSDSFQNSVFLLDANDILYSFGANEYGQLCRGILPSQSNFVATAGIVSLPSGEVPRRVITGYGITSILTISGNLYSCGFNGNGLFQITSESLNFGIFNDTFSVTLPTRFTIPPTVYYKNPTQFASVSHFVGGIMAVTQDGKLVTCHNSTCSIRSDDGSISSRRISASSSFSYGFFVAAGPLEPQTYALEIPETAEFIRIGARGLPALFRPVTPADRIEVHLSEQSCTVTFTGVDYSSTDLMPFLLCKIDGAGSFTPNSTLTAVLSVRGDVSASFTVGSVVPSPQVTGDPSTQYISWGGTRTLQIEGSNFGTVKDHVQVHIVLMDPNAPLVPCNVVYVEETLVKCEVFIPANQFGYVYLRLTRLFAKSSELPAAWGQTITPWVIQNMDAIIPGNAKAVVALGNLLSFPVTATAARFSVTYDNGTVTQPQPCASISVGSSFGGRDALSCELPVGVLQRNITFAVEVTRAGITETARVGRVGPPLSISSRPNDAKVAEGADFFMLPSPVSKDYFVSTFGQGFFSAITANVFINSNKRAALANETNSVNCTVSDMMGDFFLCYADRSKSEELPLAPGQVWANIDVRGYSLNFQSYLGTVVGDPTVTPSVSSKVAMALGTEVTIRGSGFAFGPFRTSDNFVRLSFRYNFANGPSNDITVNCGVLEASQDFLICNASQQIFATPGTTLSAVVSSWGGVAPSTVVGTLVNPAMINIWRDRVNSSNTQININGTGFADNIADNRVRVSRQTEPRSWVTCELVLAESRFDTLVCKLPDTQLVSNDGDRLVFQVYSNGAWSWEANAVVGNNGDRLGGDAGVIGPAVGISVAIFALIVLAILVFLLVRRKRKLQDIKGQLHQVPEAFASMFNIKTSDLEIIRKLGEGSFGAVFLAKYKSPKGEKRVAVKKLTSSMLASSVDGFFREATLMMSIAPNKNVVRLYGLCQELNNFSLVMDYLELGALDSYCSKIIKAGQSWDPNLLYRIAIGIARGMAHLASSGIVHRDLAARNILLSDKCEPKVSDFGMSRVLNSEGASGKTNSNVGPIRWMSPENIRDRTFSEKSDVWAYGVLLFELITGDEPYPEEDMLEVAVSIRDTGRNPMSTIPKDAKPPKYLLEVMELCFKINPDERPTFKDIEALLVKRRPSGYRSEAEDSEDNLLGIQSNRKRSKSKRAAKKGKKGAGSDDHAVEMDHHVSSGNSNSNYGPISNTQNITNTTTSSSNPDSQKPAKKAEPQPRPAPKYGAIGIPDEEEDVEANEKGKVPSPSSSSSSSSESDSDDE